MDQLNEKLDQQNITLESAISNIDHISKSLYNSAESLDEIEERLFLIRSLARKFSTTVDELPQVVSEAQNKLQLLQNEFFFN